MRFGVTPQHYREHASSEAIVEVAQVAEELGFDSVWVMDHVIVPDVPEAKQFTYRVYDPFVTLSYVAAKTERVRLGTSVLIPPYRDPLSQAKTLSTLDDLSGGRLDIGVGSGWLKAEFDALCVPFKRRGALTDEYLEIMRLLGTAERTVSYEGDRFGSRTYAVSRAQHKSRTRRSRSVVAVTLLCVALSATDLSGTRWTSSSPEKVYG